MTIADSSLFDKGSTKGDKMGPNSQYKSFQTTDGLWQIIKSFD